MRRFLLFFAAFACTATISNAQNNGKSQPQACTTPAWAQLSLPEFFKAGDSNSCPSMRSKGETGSCVEYLGESGVSEITDCSLKDKLANLIGKDVYACADLKLPEAGWLAHPGKQVFHQKISTAEAARRSKTASTSVLIETKPHLFSEKLLLRNAAPIGEGALSLEPNRPARSGLGLDLYTPPVVPPLQPLSIRYIYLSNGQLKILLKSGKSYVFLTEPILTWLQKGNETLLDTLLRIDPKLHDSAENVPFSPKEVDEIQKRRVVVGERMETVQCMLGQAFRQRKEPEGIETWNYPGIGELTFSKKGILISINSKEEARPATNTMGSSSPTQGMPLGSSSSQPTLQPPF